MSVKTKSQFKKYKFNLSNLALAQRDYSGVVPAPGRTFFRATQVEFGLRPEQIKLGMNIAVLADREEHRDGTAPVSVFLAGKVTKIWGNPDDPIMTITYKDTPEGFGESISFGIKQYAHFCIKWPKGQPHGR